MASPTLNSLSRTPGAMLSEVDAAAAAAADVPVVPAEAVEVVNYAATALANADAPRRGVLIEFLVDHAPTDRCECHRSGAPIGKGELRIQKRNTTAAGFVMKYSFTLVGFFQMLDKMKADTARPHAAADLLGYDALGADDQATLDALFARFHDANDDAFPPPEARGAPSAAARKHKRDTTREKSFACPAPGCTKVYGSANCMWRHKRNKHPELVGTREHPAKRTAGVFPALMPPAEEPLAEAPAPAVPEAAAAAVPEAPEVEAASSLAADVEASLSRAPVPPPPPPPPVPPPAPVQPPAPVPPPPPVQPPPPVPPPAREALAAPPALAHVTQLSRHQPPIRYLGQGEIPVPPRPEPPAAVPSAFHFATGSVLGGPTTAIEVRAELPKGPLGGYATQVAAQPMGRLVCPAPGCGKTYSSSQTLYAHKRKHHPELIRPRSEGSVRARRDGGEEHVRLTAALAP